MSNYLANQSNEELWNLMRKSSKVAFACLYKRHIEALYNFGKKITSDKEIIKDTIQELFTDFWSKRNTLSDVACVKIYIFKSFRYKLIRAIAKVEKNQQPYTLESFLIEIPTEEEARDSLSLERKKILTEQLSNLPKRQREVIHLKYFHNLTNEEIAEVINVNYQSVSNILYRAIKKMKASLQSNPSKIPFY
jgi:RNA polymerase sigma factor (sigma-70 family)